jgi:6-phosphogluconolactonase (cycloisomerase 2 family)
MFLPHLKYTVAAVTVILLLTSCAGGSSTTPLASQQNQSHPGKRATSPCPCLYVANFGDVANFEVSSVTVYAQGATGDATPIQDITGSNTGLNHPTDVAVDASGNIYVASQSNSSILVYAAGSTGNVAPIQDISGPKTGLSMPHGLALNPLNGDIYVASGNFPSSASKVTIYPSGSTGNIPPTGVIEGMRTALDVPYALTFNATGKIYIPNADSNSVTIYGASAHGDSAPIRTISGSNTGLEVPTQIALDTQRRVYVANPDDINGSVTVYAVLANGNVAPIRTIAGGRTNLHRPQGIAVDGSGLIYVANAGFSIPSIVTVYIAHANGNVAPINTISGPNTGLSGPVGIAIR